MDFARLALFRRGNAGPPTPASFADALIGSLLEISSSPKESLPARRSDSGDRLAEARPWGFFTTQLRTLLAVANEPEQTIHEIAAAVGVTDRAAIAILCQLEDEGMILRAKEGRRNSYRIELDAVRHFTRWSPGPWPLQQAIVDASIEGLHRLAAKTSSATSIR